VLAACGQLQYEHMNDPARDIWQQPAAVMEALNVKEGNQVVDLGSGYFTFRFSNAVGQAGKVYRTSLAFIERQAKERGGIDNVQPSSPYAQACLTRPGFRSSLFAGSPTAIASSVGTIREPY
jgi:hypothetical protein